MTDANIRQFVYDLYPGPRWKARVNKMSDSQVFAIYMKETREKETPEEPKEDPQPDTLF